MCILDHGLSVLGQGSCEVGGDFVAEPISASAPQINLGFNACECSVTAKDNEGRQKPR